MREESGHDAKFDRMSESGQTKRARVSSRFPFGGSYVGLEFAQIYRRFGSEVTVIELAPRLIAREDEDVSNAVTGILDRNFSKVMKRAAKSSGQRFNGSKAT